MNEAAEPEQKTENLKLVFELIQPSQVFHLVNTSERSVCHGMYDTRVSEESLTLSDGDISELKEETKYAEVAKKMEHIRDYLRFMMEDKKTLTELAKLSEHEEADREKLKSILGLGDGYSWDIERLYQILNKNMDPELIPMAMEYYVQKNGLPESVIDAIKNDFHLLRRISTLISSDIFNKEFWFNSGLGSSPYQPDMKQQIETLIQDWAEGACVVGHLDNSQGIAIKAALGNFFNIEKQFVFSEEQTGANTINSLHRLTNRLYLERKTGDSADSFKPADLSYPPNLVGLVERAQYYIKGEYLVGVCNLTLSLYEHLFPQIYTNFKLENLEMGDPRQGKHNYNPTERCDQSAGYWYLPERKIYIGSPTVVEGKSAEEISNEETLHFNGPRVRRLLVDLITMTHEATHAIYDETVSKGSTVPEDYKSSADHAINEGLAVTMELLLIDALESNPQLIGLSPNDVAQLEQCKLARLYSLKKRRGGYTEGTYRILHNVYKQAAGIGEQRNMEKGLLEIKNFLSKLDPQKTLTISRTSPEYLEAIEKGNPQELLKLFS